MTKPKRVVHRKQQSKRDLVTKVNALIEATPSRLSPEVLERAFGFAMLGATNPELAALLSVNPATVDRWIAEDEAFALAVRNGRAHADANVVASLYRNATGYEYPTVKVFYDAKLGKVVEHQVMEFHSADTTAQSLWLRNRQRDRWRDINIGDGGIGIAVNIVLE